MRPHRIPTYLQDIDNACVLLEQFVKGKSLEDYAADLLLQAAVERKFMTIGEALSQAIRQDPTLAGQITDARRIISFRNRLIHGYSEVTDEVVWGTLQKDMPLLLGEVKALLAQLTDLEEDAP